MKKIKGLIKLLRFELPFAAGICVIMGQILAYGYFVSFYLATFGFLSVFFISASILVLNDYFDIETDKINAPERPIPSNLISPVEALTFGVFLMMSGLILSYLIDSRALSIAVVLAIIGFLYNYFLKKRGIIGNLAVSFSVGMTFIYGGATVGLPFNKLVVFFSLIAALINLGEEIAADAMDIKGDSLIDSESIAIKFGKRIALNISASIFLCVILFSFVLFAAEWLPLYYLIPIGVMDISIAYPTVKLLKSENDEGRKFIRWIYLGSTFGLIIFIIMRIAKI